MSFSNFKLIPSSFLFSIIVAGSLQLVLIGCSQAPSKPKNSNDKISKNWREARPSDTPITAIAGPSTMNFLYSPEKGAIVLSESDRNTFPTDSANEKIMDEAIKALGESSKSGPRRGKFACAWMVNKILQRSIGYKVNGDSTSSMNKVFQSHVASGRAQLIPASQARLGDIIISPTVWYPKRNTGHVGIVGQNGKIMSNSSTRAQWEENYTAESWYRRYEQQRGLRTFIYRITA
tara:strand:+ start:953 stop:1654 length:702 start_codon:yes stop_codon:yes gene_type:complete